jgi:hypothetical protein
MLARTNMVFADIKYLHHWLHRSFAVLVQQKYMQILLEIFKNSPQKVFLPCQYVTLLV